MSTLNWRPVREIEERTRQSVLRTKQIESEILRVRSDRERIENEILRVKNDSERIERETERLKKINAREKALSALIRQHCFPPECSSIPPQATESDCESSWS